MKGTAVFILRGPVEAELSRGERLTIDAEIACARVSCGALLLAFYKAREMVAQLYIVAERASLVRPFEARVKELRMPVKKLLPPKQ